MSDVDSFLTILSIMSDDLYQADVPEAGGSMAASHILSLSEVLTLAITSQEDRFRFIVQYLHPAFLTLPHRS
ncbi:hypothetical protein EI42_05913 [Thermosporothrix hazakensis]|uniref:Uncharacterized protein n=2 Tax=Thermosporothrix hazakensis TaxID=644383 RepID=A0A326TWG4_THEHA|nr:hypothetical protein EI42_05913 [Thermosporothrix hazakensis]